VSDNLIDPLLVIEGKWIRFRRAAEQHPKTQVWDVTAKETDGYLGKVQWFGRWRRYAFFPETGCVFEHDCLKTIAIFCENLTWRHRELAKLPADERTHGIAGETQERS
jgi:hypothetical protein